MMRTLIIILLLSSLCARAQDQIEWITPFATVDYKEDLIHYYYAPSASYISLQPLFYPPDVMIPIAAFMQHPDHEKLSNWKPIIRNEAEGRNLMGRSQDEKMKFLKAFSLQSIWGINQRAEMPSHDAWLLVVGLSDDKDTEIASKAKLSAELYEAIWEIHKEMEDLRKRKK